MRSIKWLLHMQTLSSLSYKRSVVCFSKWEGLNADSHPWLAHLCYVNLVTGQLANLKRWHVANHDLVLVEATLYDDLRLVRGVARLITSLVIDGILQIPTIGSYLRVKYSLAGLKIQKYYFIWLKQLNYAFVFKTFTSVFIFYFFVEINYYFI